MKRMLLTATVLTLAAGIHAQTKEYPKQEEMRPGMSEYWTPQPKVVTPGDEKSSSAPDDAIVLFDGKDLSAWTNGRYCRGRMDGEEGNHDCGQEQRRYRYQTEVW